MEKRLEKGKNKIMNALLERRGMQYIIDTASEVLGNPIFIGDASYKVFLCSSMDEPDDPFWAQVQQKTFPADPAILQVFHTQDFFDMYAKDDPVKILCPGSKHHLLGARYRDGGHVMGHIAIYELRKPFDSDDEELLKVLCKVFAYETLYREKEISGKVKYYSFFCSLLEGNTYPDSELSDYMRLFSIKLPPKMLIAVIRTKRTTSGVMLNYIREEIMRRNVGIMAVVYCNQIVMLINAEKNWKETMNQYCERYALSCSISYPFENLNNLKISYCQSVRTAELASRHAPEGMINDYRQYAIDDLLAKAENAEDIFYPPVRKLADEDRQNHTDYIRTLSVWLKNEGNIAKTSKEMCIHKNSMYYRLTRIEQILECDLHDGNMAILLALSLKILQSSKEQ